MVIFKQQGEVQKQEMDDLGKNDFLLGRNTDSVSEGYDETVGQ